MWPEGLFAYWEEHEVAESLLVLIVRVSCIT